MGSIMLRLGVGFLRVWRGVKVLWIAESRPLNFDPRLYLKQCFWRNSHFDLRTLPHPVNNRLGIYDDKQLFVATTRQADVAKAPALWTNNPTILDILLDYFEMKWELAQEYNTNED
jgi:hypothetical protein